MLWTQIGYEENGQCSYQNFLQSLYLPYFVLRLVDVVFIPFSKKQTCFCRTRIYVVRVVFVSLAFVMNYELSRRRRVFLNEVKQKD